MTEKTLEWQTESDKTRENKDFSHFVVKIEGDQRLGNVLRRLLTQRSSMNRVPLRKFDSKKKSKIGEFFSSSRFDFSRHFYNEKIWKMFSTKSKKQFSSSLKTIWNKSKIISKFIRPTTKLCGFQRSQNRFRNFIWPKKFDVEPENRPKFWIRSKIGSVFLYFQFFRWKKIFQCGKTSFGREKIESREETRRFHRKAQRNLAAKISKRKLSLSKGAAAQKRKSVFHGEFVDRRRSNFFARRFRWDRSSLSNSEIQNNRTSRTFL